MPHLDLAEFRRFCKEKFIFTYDTYIALENNKSNKANIKRIEDVHITNTERFKRALIYFNTDTQYAHFRLILFRLSFFCSLFHLRCTCQFIINLIPVVHCITTLCHDVIRFLWPKKTGLRQDRVAEQPVIIKVFVGECLCPELRTSVQFSPLQFKTVSICPLESPDAFQGVWGTMVFTPLQPVPSVAYRLCRVSQLLHFNVP